MMQPLSPIECLLRTIERQKSAGLRRFFSKHANDNLAAVILGEIAVLVNDGIVAL